MPTTESTAIYSTESSRIRTSLTVFLISVIYFVVFFLLVGQIANFAAIVDLSEFISALKIILFVTPQVYILIPLTIVMYCFTRYRREFTQLFFMWLAILIFGSMYTFGLLYILNLP